jgi:hypothetical protein
LYRRVRGQNFFVQRQISRRAGHRDSAGSVFV